MDCTARHLKNVKFPDKRELVTNEVFVCLRSVFRPCFCIYFSKMLFDQLMEINLNISIFCLYFDGCTV